MKKFLVIFIGIIALISGVLFLNRQSENIVQKLEPILSYGESHWLLMDENTSKEGIATPTENAVFPSYGSTDILLVNAENPLPSDFRPENLIRLCDQKHQYFQLSRADIEVCGIVFEAMEAMFSAAKKNGVDGFIITSGYRSYDEQKEVFANSPAGIAAQPGTSEHETGLAFDVTAMGNKNFELTPQFEWLSKHCGEYGFILRYTKDSENITGYPSEPWHYRYVGLTAAKEIMDEGITLEEYMKRL